MAEEAKKRGNDAFLKKEYDEAIKHFTEAISLDGKNHILFSNRSAAYAGKGMYQEALNDAEKCISINPSFVKGYSRKGTALQFLHRPDEAMEAYEEGLKIDPNNDMLKEGLETVQNEIQSQSANMFLNLFQGDVFSKLAANPETAHLKDDPAFVQKVKMIQSNPQMMNQFMQDKQVLMAAMTLLGINLKADYPMADNETKPQPQPQPKPQTQTQSPTPKKEEPKKEISEAEKEKELGNVEYKKKNFEEALKHYEKAIELEPNSLVFASNKAAVLIEMGRNEEAVELCERGIEKSKEQKDYDMLAKFLTRQGSAYLANKEYEKAIACFQSSLTESRSAITLNKLRQAEKEFELAKANAYESPEIAEQERIKGNEFFKQNNFPEAIKCYTEAIKRAPKMASLYSNRSGTYINLLEFTLALKDAEQCLQLDPTFVRGYVRKGAAHFYMKEYVKALDTYQQGLKIDPNNEECKKGIENVENQIRHQQASGTVDEQQIAHAMADPEIQAILSDPIINNVIRDMMQHPETISKHLSNPDISAKVEKLIASGILRTSPGTK